MTAPRSWRRASSVQSAANANRIDRLVRAVSPLPHVSGVVSPLSARADHQISADHTLAYATVQFDEQSDTLPVASINRVIATVQRFAAPAVVNGLASTAKVIIAAAAIMISVFGSFVVNDPLRILDVFGLGLAVAILIDATVIRMILVPAVMELLGTRTWWMPSWLERLC